MDDGLTKSTTIYISDKTHLNLTFNLCQCGITEILTSGRIGLYEAGAFELLYLDGGSGLLETGQFAFRIGAKQGIFAFPDESYTLSNVGTEPLHVTWMTFTGYQVEYYLSRANIFRTKPIFSDDGKVGDCMGRIYAVSQTFPNRYCKMMSAFYDIFSILLDANPTKKSENFTDASNFLAASAVKYIEHNYAKDISVDEIAEMLGISRKHLYAVFNEVLKMPPRQYLIYFRIEKACKRLKNTSQTIQEIAESIGYANQFYFAKEFKRLLGVSPSDYRKNADLTEIFSFNSFVPTLTEQGNKLSISVSEKEAPAYFPPTVIQGVSNSNE